MTPSEFRAIRKALGLRQSDLAAILRVTRETVQRYETGKRDEIPGPVTVLMEALAAGAMEKEGKA